MDQPHCTTWGDRCPMHVPMPRHVPCTGPMCYKAWTLRMEMKSKPGASDNY